MKKTLFLVLFALLGLASAWAYDFSAVAPTGQTLYYTITSSSSHTVSVVPPYSTGWSSSNTPTGSLTIPSTVTYGGTAYSVTSIGGAAFADCSGLTSVTIPNSVTSIGSHAFFGCSGLTGSLTIPNSVTSIGSCAFAYCTSLNHVTFNAQNCEDFERYSYNDPRLPFTGCTNISTFTLGNSVQRIPAYLCYGLAITSITIPNSVTSIGSSAFYGCSGLTGSLTIPNSVTSIGGSAFEGCSGLTGSLTIPNSVTSIGDRAFYGCSGLTGSLTIPNSVTSIGSLAFAGCSGLTGSLTIPNSVTSIGGSAFSGCSGLTGHLTIPNSVASIGDGAFSGCSGLTGSLTIPNSVTSIGDRAFYRCSGLTGSLTIPNSVTSIGSSAFAGCSGLTGSLIISDSVASIGDGAFSGCSGLTSVTIPNSVTSIGTEAFYGCSSLTSVIIPDSVSSIGNCAFNLVKNIIYHGAASGDPWCALTLNGYVDGDLIYSDSTKTHLTGCNISATSVTIPNSVVSIGFYAFRDCRSLTSVDIPNTIAVIDYCVFENCSSLASVTIPNSVTYIGIGAFAGSGLTSVTIPNSVTEIGSEAFYDCNSLTSVTIPDSVVYIGDLAFADCSSLSHVTFNARNCGSNAYASGLGVFSGCINLTTFTIGDSVQSIPDGLCARTVITSIDIPNSVTSIGGYAFYMDSNLTSVTIPNSVTSIGYRAFGDCGSLTSVTIGKSVEIIGGYAFANCSTIAEITSKRPTPPELGNRTFQNVPTDIPVYVHCGRSERYRSAWSDFSNFVETFLRTLQVESNDEAMGSVSVLQQPTCDDKTGIVEAVPSYGYLFDHWSNGTTENPYTLQVTRDTVLTACFTRDSTVGISSVVDAAYEVSSEQGGIVVKAAAGERVRVFDIAGRLLYQGRIEEEPWHYRVEKSGVYLVQIADSPAQKVVVIE